MRATTQTANKVTQMRTLTPSNGRAMSSLLTTTPFTLTPATMPSVPSMSSMPSVAPGHKFDIPFQTIATCRLMTCTASTACARGLHSSTRIPAPYGSLSSRSSSPSSPPPPLLLLTNTVTSMHHLRYTPFNVARSFAGKGLLGSLSDEFEHLNEALQPAATRRVQREMEFRRMGAGAVGPAVPPSTKHTDEGWNFRPDTANQDLEEAAEAKQRADDEAKAQEELDGKEAKEGEEGKGEAKEEDAEANEEAVDAKFYAPVVVDGGKPSVWRQRMESLQQTLRGSKPYAAYRDVKHKIVTSDAPVVKKVRELSEQMQNKVEDARDTFDTSQHPSVHKLRDLSDSFASESETGFVLNKLAEFDPTFSYPSFLRELEEDLIPLVITAYLLPDPELLKKITEENAARFMFRSVKQRERTKEVWSPVITDIKNIEITDAKWIHEQPHLCVKFSCQQVTYTTDENGAWVSGSQTGFQTRNYEWILRPDYDSLQFKWKLNTFKVKNQLLQIA